MKTLKAALLLGMLAGGASAHPLSLTGVRTMAFASYRPKPPVCQQVCILWETPPLGGRVCRLWKTVCK